MEQILLILVGLGLCAAAVLDFKGSTALIGKQFRDMPEMKEWQRTNAVYEGVIGLCVIAISLFGGSMLVFVAAGALMLVMCVLMARHNQVMAMMKMDYLRELKQDAEVKARRAAEEKENEE